MATNTIIEGLVKVQVELLRKYNLLSETIEILKSDADFNMELPSEQETILQKEIVKDKQVLKAPKTTLKVNDDILNPKSVEGRIMAILKEANRFVTRKEIEDIAAKSNMPFKNSTAATLSQIKKEGKRGLMLVNINSNSSVWGLKEWVNEDGSIKLEHHYNRGTIF